MYNISVSTSMYNAITIIYSACFHCFDQCCFTNGSLSQVVTALVSLHGYLTVHGQGHVPVPLEDWSGNLSLPPGNTAGLVTFLYHLVTPLIW